MPIVAEIYTGEVNEVVRHTAAAHIYIQYSISDPLPGIYKEIRNQSL